MTKHKVRSGLRLTKELNDQYKELAKSIGITKNALMIEALRYYLEHREAKAS